YQAMDRRFRLTYCLNTEVNSRSTIDVRKPLYEMDSIDTPPRALPYSAGGILSAQPETAGASGRGICLCNLHRRSHCLCSHRKSFEAIRKTRSGNRRTI